MANATSADSASLRWWSAPAFRESGWAPVSTEGSTVSSSLYFQAVLVLQLAVCAWEVYLHWRQHRVLKNPKFPPRLARALEAADRKRLQSKSADQSAAKSADQSATEPQSEPPSAESLLLTATNKFAQTRAYGLDKSTFAIVSSVLRQAEATASLLLGFLPFAWTVSGQLVSLLGLDPSHEVTRALAMGSLTLLHDALVALPFSLYATFVIEARHGFNKQTLVVYMTENLKIAALVIAIQWPLTAFLIVFVRWVGDAFFVYLPVVMSLVFTVLFSLIPQMATLFEKCHALEDGSLRTKISQLASSLSFSVKNIVVNEASAQSSHSNAAIRGLGKNKTIYLDDTLMQQTTEDEILAVLCHEIGHSQRWHFHRGMASAMVVDFVKFFIFAQCLHDAKLLAAFGFVTPTETVKAPLVVGYLLFSMAVWAPMGPLFKFAAFRTSRKLEFEADEFAVDQGFGSSLQSGLTRLHAANMMTVQFDPLYSAYHNNHPPLLERLDAVEARHKKQQ